MFILGIVCVFVLIGIMLLCAKFIKSDKLNSIEYVIAKIVYSIIYMGTMFCLILVYAVYTLYFGKWENGPVESSIALIMVWIFVDFTYNFFLSNDDRGLIECEKYISKILAIISAVMVFRIWGIELEQTESFVVSYVLWGVLISEIYTLISCFTKRTIRVSLKNIKECFANVKPYVLLTDIVLMGIALFLATQNSVVVNIKEFWAPFYEGLIVGVCSACTIILFIAFLKRIGVERKMFKQINVWSRKKKLWNHVLKIFISLMFIGLFVVRIKHPELNIDAISIILLVLAMFPWYSKYIKALELNGIGKVELVSDKEKEELEEKAAKLVVPDKSEKENLAEKYSFYALRYTDMKLALAGLRIEIERELKQIAERNGIKNSIMSLGKLTELLSQRELITRNEYALIRDIIVVLNKAVHSQLDDYKIKDFEWVFEIGLDVLESLKRDNVRGGLNNDY
ncbi:MAG: hypothetical protein IJA07_06810 [Agathobacter sp.]|nr:hypothetical protein [Agathobacter sp.]